jgi:delta24-sterol reductase
MMEFKSKESHLSQVKRLQTALHQKNKIFSLKNGAVSNTLRNGEYKKNTEQLDLSAFSAILAFCPEEMWILVEPKLTFEALCRFTLRHGLAPLVVPEFKTITVGGAIMGAALESSSHRFGQFNDTCLEYECLLGNGELVYASDTQNAALFYGCAGSYGTLALLTAVKIQLRPAKKWVRLNYIKADVQKAVELLTAQRSEDFAEGIVYNSDQAIVITGELADRPSAKKTFRQSLPWSQWYVHHLLQTNNRQETMPIFDYLFRMDRGGFWIGQYVHSFVTMSRLLLRLGIPKVKENGDFRLSLLFRLLFGWAFTSQRLFQLWHRVPNAISNELFFIHDFYAPFPSAQDALAYFMEKTEIFPLWICPIKGSDKPQFLSPHYGRPHFLNIGLYGVPKKEMTIPQLSALLEQKILDYGGRKMLYSFTYYDRELFSKIYFEQKYESLRQTYGADLAFPSLFQKVSVR